MITSCGFLQAQEEIEKCRNGFNSDDKLTKLQSKSALMLCREQQLCKPDEKPQELEVQQRPTHYVDIPEIKDSIKPQRDQNYGKQPSSQVEESYS